MPRTTTNATSYASRLSQSKEVKEEAAQGRAVRTAQHALNGKILELSIGLERKEGDIEILKSSAQLNIEGILLAQVRINELKLQIAALTELQTELFPA